MVKQRDFVEAIKLEDNKIKDNWRLKLDDNENIYGCSNSVFSMLKSLKNTDVSLYPKDDFLLEKFKTKYKQDKNKILFTSGRQEAYNAFIYAYLSQKEDILAPISAQGVFDFCTNNIYSQAKYFNFDSDLNINVAYIKQNISLRTKIVYISTPDEITGKTLRASMIEQIAQECDDILFILDCTYIDYCSQLVLQDYLDLIEKYKNIAIIKSFSKAYGLAGMRFACVFANEEIINTLKKVISKNSVNSVALNCVSMVLFDDKKLQETKEFNEKAKQLLINELEKRGFKSIDGEGNFVLCDFSSRCNFYYNKLKHNGVLVKKFPKDSYFSSCLRITVPTLGGVKYISELLNKKDVLAFELDGVLFNVSNGYQEAIICTYFSFAKKETTYADVCEIKKINALGSDFEAIKYLLEQDEYYISEEEILKKYRELFFDNKNLTNNSLINKQNFLLSKQVLDELVKKFDLAIYSNRFKDEIKYLLEKFDIDEYFYEIISFEDVDKEVHKPHPFGVKKLIEATNFEEFYYFGADADDVIAGNLANIKTIGVMAPNCDYNKMYNNYKHLGASYVLEDITNILDFLLEIKEEKNELF